MNYPDNNPKTAVGVSKAPLHLVPPSATHYLALAFKDGAAKYGPYNWRDKTVSSSVYIGAVKRHIDAWWDGEDLSTDANVEHLAHAMACLAIILDAKSVGKLNDDRPTKGAASRLQSEFAAPVPKQLEFDFKEQRFEQARAAGATKLVQQRDNVTRDRLVNEPLIRRLKDFVEQTIGSPVSTGYSGFLEPSTDTVEQRRVPDVQENLREKAFAAVRAASYDTR